MPLTTRQRSIHNKNGPKRTTSFKTKRSSKGNEGEFIYTYPPSDLKSIAYPGGAVALFLLLIARLASACWGHIADCDETYNYWEPLHYLVYGSGLQTWEYSPAFALRSYAPLWLLAGPARLLAHLLPPPALFYTLRAALATLSACAELALYKAACRELGVHAGRLWLALALPAAGCFAAAAALLPSAWSGALITAAMAAWWRRRYPLAIFLVAASTILSWPFTALLGVPIALDMVVLQRRLAEFVKWSLVALVVTLAPTVAVDSWHYGRLVVAPWNIVAYNVFTEHGPDLYGVEPWTYYFVNGFLNFNIVWVLALAWPVLAAAAAAACGHARAPFCRPHALLLLPLPLWLAVFLWQPHKEERFLYPVYSLVVAAGALALDCVQRLTCALRGGGGGGGRARHYLARTGALAALAVLLAGLAGVSRIVALHQHYHGPMRVLRALPPVPESAPAPALVCYGKEWYRFPSSFLLPPGYSARFVPSDFEGQLPAPFAASADATRVVPPYLNDANVGDNRTYVAPERCHYLVDSDVGAATERQPHYHARTQWRVVASEPLLDARASPVALRAFYVPVLSTRHNVYGRIYLLQNRALA